MLKLDRDFWSCYVHLSVRGRRKTNGKFDWSEALVDSGIIAGISFCTGFGGLLAADAFTVQSFLMVATITVGEFLGLLAAKRGLPKQKR